jgi:hypothetical protein
MNPPTWSKKEHVLPRMFDLNSAEQFMTANSNVWGDEVLNQRVLREYLEQFYPESFKRSIGYVIELSVQNGIQKLQSIAKPNYISPTY